ncbi:MAG: hypothetical protein LBH43_15015 [Treponema sp.]|jgi:hypothetical protein|nr:hypothetical protein [Treponema sp.]
MREYKPLRAALLVYDFLRLAALALLFAFFSPLEGALHGRLFPYLVYLTPNALFPLMALFVFIGIREFKNYLPLYLAGKLIMLVTFYVWSAVSLIPAMNEPYMGLQMDKIGHGVILFLSSIALSIGDALSIFGSWFMLNKIRLSGPGNAGENGGI